METIKNYLDNIFAFLPKTNQMLKLKNDLLWNMEEKYNNQINDGKSVNEAIVIVIPKFEDIPPLINKFGIECTKEEMAPRCITQEEADRFMAAKKKSGLLVGIGVSLCIMAVAIKKLITTLLDDGIIGRGLSNNVSDMLGPIVVIILIISAAALFIYSYIELEKYEYLQNVFDLPLHVKAIIEQKHEAFVSTHMVSIIIGVSICILSPVALSAASVLGNDSSTYGVVVLLIMVAIAVFLFVYFGNIKKSFSILLRISDFSK